MLEISKQDIIADLHTHTVASGHAFSTLAENVNVAFSNGIKYIAVTDHLVQSDDRIEMDNILARVCYARNCKPKNGVKVISGVEMNIRQVWNDYADIVKFNKNVKWRPVGLHDWFINPCMYTLEEVYNLYADVVNKGHPEYIKPTAFAHIERNLHKFRDTTEEKITEYLYAIVDLAVANNIYLEINESSLVNYNINNHTRMQRWVKYANDKNAMFSLGTDAHYCDSVGDFTNVLELVNSIGISCGSILNHSYNEELLKVLT